MFLNYYGLSDKPFEITPDPKFLFLTPGHKASLEALLKGVEERAGVIILTGEVGTGKTVLLYSALGRLSNEVKTAFVFHSTYNFQELLKQVLVEWGLPNPAEALGELKAQFLKVLQKAREQGKILVILIDEAQKLSRDVIRELFSLLRLESGKRPSLQLVLAGQPELDSLLEPEILRNPHRKLGRQLKIYPLTRTESFAYIEHRLQLVGSSSARLFSPQALALICEFSQGIPRLINIVCDNALLNGYSQSQQKIDLGIVEKVIGNLEGPGYKPKTRLKAPEDTVPARFFPGWSLRKGLIILSVLALGIGIFFWGGEIKNRIVYLEVLEEVKGLFNKGQQLISASVSRQENTIRPKGDLSITGDHQKISPKGSFDQSSQRPGLTEIRRIQVKKGESLSKLSLHYYGKSNASLVDLILMANPSIINADYILVDQKIQLPELREEALLLHGPDKSFAIHLGTFLSNNQAHKFKNELDLKGKEITIQPRKISPTQTWYRVEAGGYGSKKEALEDINILRRKGLLSFF
jgi:general secretion pathway protein A